MVQPETDGQSGGKRPILPPPPPDLASGGTGATERPVADAKRAQEEAEQARREAEEAERRREEAAAAKRAEREAKQAERQRAREERQSAKAAATRQRAEQKTQLKAQQKAQQQATRQQAAVPSGQATRGRGAPPAPARRTRRAQLRLVQVDAWSVMKTSFLLSIAIGIVLIVAVAIIWAVLGAAGVWDSVNSIVQQAVGSADGPQFDITDYLGTSRVLGITALVAAFDVVLITAIATLGAFLYNLSAALLGGVEVTLAEDN